MVQSMQFNNRVQHAPKYGKLNCYMCSLKFIFLHKIRIYDFLNFTWILCTGIYCTAVQMDVFHCEQFFISYTCGLYFRARAVRAHGTPLSTGQKFHNITLTIRPTFFHGAFSFLNPQSVFPQSVSGPIEPMHVEFFSIARSIYPHADSCDLILLRGRSTIWHKPIRFPSNSLTMVHISTRWQTRLAPSEARNNHTYTHRSLFNITVQISKWITLILHQADFWYNGPMIHIFFARCIQTDYTYTTNLSLTIMHVN